MGKFKPVVTAKVSSKGQTISANFPQPALQCGQLSALCSWLTLVFDVVSLGSFYAFSIKAKPAEETIVVTDDGWSPNRFVINRSWEEFLDLQEKLPFYTSATIKFGLNNSDVTPVNVFEYAWNLLEEEL